MCALGTSVGTTGTGATLATGTVLVAGAAVATGTLLEGTGTAATG